MTEGRKVPTQTEVFSGATQHDKFNILFYRLNIFSQLAHHRIGEPIPCIGTIKRYREQESCLLSFNLGHDQLPENICQLLVDFAKPNDKNEVN